MGKCQIIIELCLMNRVYLYEDAQIKIVSNVPHLMYLLWYCTPDEEQILQSTSD